ncbi:Na+/H+ antiporter subunit E [Schinkia azotoformans]|nr:Na+/H+ antiporter subunit E [Schinkia azotoformans]MEC1639623.1 Na+/H+ antiporter subunit E [Schinkia azotoformans]MEC1722428.1 Na+/H+ antiporter subunit E [Schinkia azotoformans]MEC1946923.1 Na+/H+ antiporter subunit E [Schinkia azotoformans]MED4350811.1 Na+/H+ antiporter subunit E [Schinkia azotoformans]MED4414802.1 Na+/H+ antiporter subunit E [Schinkia azotoformans]
MSMQVLINLFIGVLWMFLQDNWGLLTFFSGYLFGLLVLFILRRYFPTKFYPITLFAIMQLVVLFFYELFISSITVVRQVIRPRINVTPGIFTLKTELEGDLEVILLALLLTLTPGSVVVEVSPDNKKFYIHAMDIPESSDAVIRSTTRFEAAIKKVTRP